VTTCDGSYSLPVIDNDWFVETETDDFTAFYKGLSPESVSRFLTVAGADVDDVNFIVGPWRSLPRITGWDSDDTTVGSHILLFAYGFSLGSAPQVFFDAVPATVVAYSTTRGGIVVQVPGGLTPGTYDVTVVNTDLGETSPPACIEVAAGTFTPVCTLNGKTTDMGGNLADVIVVADNGGSFIRGVVTDGNGDWSMSLDAAGIYEVDLLPPPGSGVVDGYYDLTCGVTQNHFFDAGFEISGQVISQSGEGVSGAGVGAADGFDFYDTFTITDEDGFFSLIVWAGTYDVGFDAPSESHFTGANGVQLTVGAPAQMGQIVMDQGSLFTGRVVDGDDNGILAEVSVFRQDNMMQVDAVGTESCEGRFNFALPDASYGLDILDVTGVGVQDARVSWINLNGDQSADFDFALFDPSSLAPATTAPEITWIDPSPSLQQGQPVILSSGNLGGAVVDVLFSDGVGGFVNGTSTAVDASRGRVATKVPAGTASGQMKLRVDGMDSRLVPYTLLPGLFSAGGLTVGGSVSGTGTGNSFVIVSWKDLSADCDDDDGIVVDYGFADGGGNYGPLSHPGGEIEVAFLPPDGTILVSASEFRSGVIGNITVDTTLVNGLAVTARILDDGMNPVKDARLYYEGDGPGNYDEKLTDANGDVTLHMSAGDWFFGVIPPARSRLLEAEFQQMIAGPFNFGDQQMTRGVLTSSAIQKDFDGSPLAGEPAEANGIFDPFPFYAETFSGLDGRFRMPVEAGVLYRARVEVTDDTLADRRYGRTSNVAYDDIAYPALKSGPAGAIGGLVRGADTMTPLEDISVAAYYEDPMNPGSPSIFTSGFASTCVDGTYQIKVDEGPHLVEFNDFNSGNYVSEWYDDEVCVDNAAIVVVTEGNTTTVDADVQLAGTITGIVRDSGVPIAGATICATSVMVDACYQACTPPTDGSGMYSLSVPPATDYVVSAFEPMLGTQCYNGFESCSGSNPVSVTAGMTTPDIDFSFGCSFDDDDMDGVDECSGDCDDSDPDNYPGNTEVCDGQDNDCDLDVDDDDAGVTGQPLWYQDLDADGAGDPGVSLAACAMPVVYVSSNDDCDPADGTIYPGAPEVNDGIDNNCDGDDGFGLIDEISGMAGFFNLGDLNEFSWPAQSGASMYKVARSTSGDFIDPSVTFTTVQNWWSDPTSPAVGQVLYYVVRSIAPNDGSWGNESSGTERDVNVLPNGDLEDWSGASNLSIWEEVSVGGTFAQETDPAHISRGGRAARLTRTGAGGIILFQRNLPLTPGQDYTLSFKAKFSAIEANAVEARLVNITAGQDLQLNGTWAPPVTFRNFALDTNYQTISIPFTVDAGFAPTDELRVILRHNNGTAIGTMLWLDDVRIEE
ncbi:MAG: MopE-related protein, partial [Acidobacteriota bacterium]|nr:MopE-related protein [Acidobacteriota bacterium]